MMPGLVAKDCAYAISGNVFMVSNVTGLNRKGEFSKEVFRSYFTTCISPAKPRTFSLISDLKPFTIATDRIMTARPSIIPSMAMRTISFEKVRLELKVMRFAMKKGKFKLEMDFLLP